VDVAREIPNVALGLTSALGGSVPENAFATIDSPSTANAQSSAGAPAPSSAVVPPGYSGPGLRKAEAIFELVSELQALVDGNLDETLKDNQDKLLPGALARLSILKDSLMGNKDRASKDGRAILDSCQEVDRAHVFFAGNWLT
jgi:hypothetical protein